jgi:hypothetical protein
MSEHTETSTGRSRRLPRDHARELLKNLRIENPNADRSALVKLYIDHVRPIVDGGDDPNAVEGLVISPLREWIAANIVEPRQRDTQPAEKRRAQREALVADIGARDNKRIDDIVTTRLLEYEMMDGRRLGDLTGAECRNLSERCGVFFHVISEQIANRAKVRNHFTELELQSLARHHKLIRP